MDRWRGTLVQLACVAAVVVLGSTATPDRELKILALAIIGMIGGAAVTRGKLDAMAQAVARPGGPGAAALAVLAGASLPPGGSGPPPASQRLREWTNVAGRWAALVGAVVLALLMSSCQGRTTGPGSVADHQAELAACNARSLAAPGTVEERRAVYVACARDANRRHGVDGPP